MARTGRESERWHAARPGSSAHTAASLTFRPLVAFVGDGPGKQTGAGSFLMRHAGRKKATPTPRRASGPMERPRAYHMTDMICTSRYGTCVREHPTGTAGRGGRGWTGCVQNARYAGEALVGEWKGDAGFAGTGAGRIERRALGLGAQASGHFAAVCADQACTTLTLDGSDD